MSPSRPDDERRHAANLLAEFLESNPSDLAQAFEAFCETHASESEALRELYALEQEATRGVSVLGRLRRTGGDTQQLQSARKGDVIGEFQLMKLIASGGQGEVWEAEQRSLGRRVALKLVRPDRVSDKTLAFFAREARAGGRLSHPGIVSVYGYGEDAGRHWISQELIPGGLTLRHLIDEVRSEPQLPSNYYQAAALLVAKLADALHAAHEAGVIHRDVKPHNVLMDATDQPKLTDFGLARITDELALSMSGDVAGTWLYMSPEQVAPGAAGLDLRTDIFSLGVVMYEVLALQRPFEGDTSQQIAENILSQDPPDLHKLRSRVPQDLAIICSKALEKRRQDRYATAAELADDIRRYLAHEPILAQAPGPLARSIKWVQRNPTKSIAMACVAAAFVVISGLSYQLSESNEALGIKSEEAAAKAVEAERRTQDVLQLSVSQDLDDLTAEADALWPVAPERVESLAAWMQRAERLMEGLPALVAKRDQLRALAIPQSEPELLRQREAHPDYWEYTQLQLRAQVARYALQRRLSGDALEPQELDRSQYPQAALGLNELAWEMVRPDRLLFGDELLGWTLAAEAVERAEDAHRSWILDTLAWGCLSLGDDAGALDASQAAREAATPEQVLEADTNHKLLTAAVEAASSATGIAAAKAELEGFERTLEQLDQLLNVRQNWSFPEELERESRARWWHNQLSRLIEELRAFGDPQTGLASEQGVDERHGWSVPRRFRLATEIRSQFEPGGLHAGRWTRDLPAIQKAYPGLQLEVQLSLVPIGVDPDSGLWEFWHVPSGLEPKRDATDQLQVTEDTGMVFALLPGGTFWMGASAQAGSQNYDQDAMVKEGPVHQVDLSAFFLSKYEMTQGQWERLAGWNRSLYGPHGNWDPSWNQDGTRVSLMHPITNVSWLDCYGLTKRWALSLPTEAQWEYGCRAMTTEAYWSGAAPETLQDAANLADAYAKGHGGELWPGIQSWLQDGFTTHSPVDAQLANPFGLHNVHGNVWEWCLDGGEQNAYAGIREVDPLFGTAVSPTRRLRGGSFVDSAVYARSAQRNIGEPDLASYHIGLRPARLIVK